jgi:hypothetical protein
MIKAIIAAVAAVVGLSVFVGMAVADEYPLLITGGHDIGPNDFGRPCTLIAAALGVKTEVFREAFSGVTPARGRGPTGDEARRNKDALMKVLAPHGVANDRLDEVSNYYRYRPQNGELWRHRDAKAHAVVEAGAVKQIIVTDAGAGYSTLPKAAIKGKPGVELVVTLLFDKDLKKNGSIKSIELKSAHPGAVTESGLK